MKNLGEEKREKKEKEFHSDIKSRKYLLKNDKMATKCKRTSLQITTETSIGPGQKNVSFGLGQK